MSTPVLYIGNKNYSSWSLRPWLAARQIGFSFDEVIIPLDQPGTRTEILRYSPTGRVPCLVLGDQIIWDSLAICETLAELRPAAKLWPEDPVARALARSVSAEMHSSFQALRQHFPMNIRGRFPQRGVTPAVQEDINRICALWRDCRRRYGAGGSLLFGHFTIADAMYAPVVSRLVTYGVALDEDSRAYVDAVMALSAMVDWVEAAKREPWIIPYAEF